MSKETRTFHINGNDYSFDFSVFHRFFETYQKKNSFLINEAEQNIADAISVSKDTIHSWRFEKNAPADMDTIQKLADFLGIKDYLILLNKKIGENTMAANDRILDSLKRIYDAIILYLDDYDTSFAYLNQFYEFKEKKYSDEEARREIYCIANDKLHEVELVDLCNIWDEKLEYVCPEGIQIYETNTGINSHEEYEVVFNRLNEIMSEYF